ncbi:MAG TPA: thioredoxin family protein [Candidatus Cloacimonadota bacterium]|nr:thioredoxin family protein [Candidatus Cloacimonadota bacterium]HQL14847.1 thioredoxin family protein [Candidatus Cloacimonadota bacterium]
MHKFVIILIGLFAAINLFSCSAKRDKNTVQTKEEKPALQQQEIQTAEAEWLTDYQKALQIAKEKNLPLLLDFTGSDWCIWCKRLNNEVFSQKAFQDYAAKNLVLVKLDFPRNLPQTEAEKKQNEALAKQFEIEGYPTIVLLNAEGKEINRTGYQAGGAENYVKHLQALLQQ